MDSSTQSYSPYFRFIKTYAPVGFLGINPNDELILELERLTEQNDQFFYIGDILQMHFIYTSRRSMEMMGVAPADLTPYHFYEATHKNDIQRHSLGRAKLFKLAHDLYVAETGYSILSTNYRIRNATGNYTNLLIQLYLYFSTVPYRSVFLLKIHTNIDWCNKMKYGFHYYIGNDLSKFRYPDEELLGLGIHFTDREFEIIRLISLGLTSEMIAEKIFLSVHTVNTHRRNILEKTGKVTMSELIYELMERGIL
jgi:DNA-binding CsgD family transcriptional regulator